jgi:O-antigen ligase
MLGYAARPRVRLAVELVFIAGWLLLRLTEMGFRPNAIWTVGAALLTLVSPVSGLVVLVAAAPWGGEQTISADHILGLRNLLPLVLAVSVVARILRSPQSLPRSRPFGVALALVAVTLLLGVGMMYATYGSATGWESAEYWLSGMGGALIVFLVAVWLGRAGERRPLWAAVIAASAAGIVSLLDYLWPAVFANLPVQGLLTANEFGTRLSGAISSPNAMVSLLVTPAAVLLAALLLAPRRWLRVAAIAVLPFLLAAMWFTYSRSALIGVFVIVVIVLWRWRRVLGAGLLVLGLAGGLALAPAYIQARGGVLGGSATVEPGKTLIASDVQRVTAWKAASAMWLDAPVLGKGFRSYHILGPQYGDQVLGSPHNEWIRLFAEEGLIGGLLGLAFAVAVALQLARTSGWLGAGAFGGFTAWAISATFNNPFIYLQVSAIALTVAGIMVGLGRERLGAPPTPARES